MNWTELLKAEAEGTYDATFGLLDLVEDDSLGFKPETGENWMTTGQLLLHIASACGFCVKGFVTGNWEMPDCANIEEMSPEEMLPPAEKMPAVETVEQARELLEKDREVALRMIEETGEADLDGRMVAAPWNPGVELPLGQHLKHMIDHLASHKAQLFYYLKLQGKPVHTGNLWGM